MHDKEFCLKNYNNKCNFHSFTQLQAKMLVADDIMDNSLTRRGRPCWYLTHNLGVKALNDALLLGGSLFYVLKKYFKNEPYYVDILDLFHDVMMKTFLGQHLDTHTALGTSVDLNKFTMARYNLICKYKTSYYSFVLPIQSAMYMVNVTIRLTPVTPIICKTYNFC